MTHRERNRLLSYGRAWKAWGPYLADRAWGTVREDASGQGDVWKYFPHEHARARAYRWGEDGIAGFSDQDQLLCFAVGLWNGRDAILKERFFGLDNAEGNHGEDCKELYFYTDAVPTHSYMRMLYKYPQAAYPYTELVQVSQQRSREEPEYELRDTGVFDESRYFDVEVEYGKADPLDICILIKVTNAGPEAAPIHVLPTLWFRNTWSWGPDRQVGTGKRPVMWESAPGVVRAEHEQLGVYMLRCGEDGSGELPGLLFCENDNHAISATLREPQRRDFNKPVQPRWLD